MRNNEQLYLVIAIKQTLLTSLSKKKTDTLKNNYSFGHTYN